MKFRTPPLKKKKYIALARKNEGLGMDKSQLQKRTKELLEKSEEPKEFIKGLQTLLKSCVDKEATKNYQRIIPNTSKYYGVPKPVLWVIASEIGKFVIKEPAKAVSLLEIVWREGSFEAKQIVAKSLEKFGSRNPKDTLKFVSSLLSDIDNWSVCDCLAMYAVEPIVYSNSELVLPLSQRWIKSENKWIRRFGVVSLRGYKKVKTTNKVFETLDLIMEDKNLDVRKAVSWILREITKGNPDDVREFLTRWAKTNSSNNAKWIIKEGMKKLNNDEQKRILKLLD
jgi:3-methyladenine DNA glycosylase AlkD